MAQNGEESKITIFFQIVPLTQYFSYLLLDLSMITWRRYLGTNTIWFLYFHVVCNNLSLIICSSVLWAAIDELQYYARSFFSHFSAETSRLYTGAAGSFFALKQYKKRRFEIIRFKPSFEISCLFQMASFRLKRHGKIPFPHRSDWMNDRCCSPFGRRINNDGKIFSSPHTGIHIGKGYLFPSGKSKDSLFCGDTQGISS